jgi:hypothetical protein
MNRKNEKGVALILALILLLIMSVMVVSLMFVSQTETWASLNYKLMSQARDGAEAGVNAAANYLINTYTPPQTGGSDPLSSYSNNVSPVTYSGSSVVLSANSSQSSNYPLNSVITAFNGNNVGQGSLAAGNVTVGYAVYATLMNQEQVTQWGSSTPTTVQIWKITSDGTINGVRTADVEVSAILEEQVTPVFSYAAFAAGPGCGAMNFGGGGSTDSYNSAAALGGGGTPVISSSGGNVGTNGNLAENGSSTTIYGTLSTPRQGTGTCTSGDVTAWTDSSGHLTCGASTTGSDCIVDLPQQVVYPIPAAPNPTPPTNSANALTLNNHASDCGGITGCSLGTGVAPSCASGDFCLAPGLCPATAGGPVTTTLGGLYGDLTVKGTVHLSAGCYNINSLTENGQGTLTIDSGPVVLNIAGTGQTTPIQLTGGGVINNAGWNPSMLQIMYGGSGTLNLKGGANAIGLIYAPGATMSFGGGASWYGAVITGNMTDMGGATINYDVNLQKQAVSVGNWMLDSFTWKKN